MTRSVARSIIALVALPVVTACGSSTAPGGLTGTYHATRMLATDDNGHTLDFVAAGATLTVTLSQDGTAVASGNMPAGVIGSTPMNEGGTGNYSVSGGILRFAYRNEAAVQAVPWQVGAATLTADGVRVGSETYAVTLTRE